MKVSVKLPNRATGFIHVEDALHGKQGIILPPLQNIISTKTQPSLTSNNFFDL